jgi:hypothetical protein
MFVQINTDNQILSDAEANERLEQRVRDKLSRFEQRLTHVEVHVADVNRTKAARRQACLAGSAPDRAPAGRRPRRGQRIDDAVSSAAGKAARMLIICSASFATRRATDRTPSTPS